MSDVELAIKASKHYESQLETRYGAVGKGLHEKATSVEHALDAQTLHHLRTLATLRNRLVHEPHVKSIENPEAFRDACNHLNALLGAPPDVDPRQVYPLGSAEYDRYAAYAGFATTDVEPLLRSAKFGDIVEAWQQASGLRFMDKPACHLDVMFWVRYLVNFRLVKALNTAASDLLFSTTVAGPEIEFELHRYVTTATRPAQTLYRAAQNVVATDWCFVGRPTVGIDSHGRESVLVKQRGLRIKKNFLGMLVCEREEAKSLASLS